MVVVTTPEFLDSDNCAEIESSLKRCMQVGIRRWVVDAGQLTYMSSAGAGVFVHLVSVAKKGEGAVVFARAQPPAANAKIASTS